MVDYLQRSYLSSRILLRMDAVSYRPRRASGAVRGRADPKLFYGFMNDRQREFDKNQIVYTVLDSNTANRLAWMGRKMDWVIFV